MKKTIALFCLAAAFNSWAGESARPAWLPAEFSSPEELAAAYQQLKNQQTRQLQTPEEYYPEEEMVEETGNDFSITVGTKFWVNRLDSSLTVPGQFGSAVLPDGSFVSIDTQSSLRPLSKAKEEVTPIPTITLRYKDFFINGNYYVPTDFEFSEEQTLNFSVSQLFSPSASGILAKKILRRDSINEREEWDVSLGWMIHPNVAIIAGYKRINQDVDFRDSIYQSFGLTDPNILVQQFVQQATFEISGPTVGIAGSLPIAELFGGVTGMYMSYSHGFFETDAFVTSTNTFSSFGLSPKVSAASREIETDYNVIEAGFSYNVNGDAIPYLPLSGASVYMGYRYQWIELMDTGKGDLDVIDRTDITQGFVGGLNINF